jgi:outer membrane protein TolC
VSQAALAVKEAENQILIDVGNRLRKLMEARQMLAVTQLAQEAAAENLRVQTDRYKQDSALLKDVLQMQATLAEATSHQRQALLAFWTARADFERSLGEDQ